MKEEENKQIDTSASAPPSAALTSNEHSYYIQNLTGFDLYWIARLENEKDDHATDAHVLPENTQQPLGKGYRRRGKRIGAALEHEHSAIDNLLVSLELEYFPPFAG